MPWVTLTIQDILNRYFRFQAPVTVPTTSLLLGLFKSTDPTTIIVPFPDGSLPAGLTELVTGTAGDLTDYARRSTVFGAPSDRQVSNTTAITFTTNAQLGSGSPAGFTITSAGLFFDATIPGRMAAFGALTTRLPVTTGSTINFPAGQIVIVDPGS